MRIVEPPIKLSQWGDVFGRTQPDIPEGFQSIAEIAKEQGLSYDRTAHILRHRLLEGKVDSISIRSNGRAVLYYRPKNYEKQPQRNKKHCRNR